MFTVGNGRARLVAFKVLLQRKSVVVPFLCQNLRIINVFEGLPIFMRVCREGMAKKTA